MSSGILWTIWDAQEAPQDPQPGLVLWRGFAAADKALVSIPEYVEQHADVLRARYLAWVHELGEAQIGGRRVLDHLELRSGFSYWWMTHLAQKFNASGNSPIDDAIRLFALEELVASRLVDAISLVSRNARLAASLREFCRERCIAFSWRRPRRNHAISLSGALRRLLPLRVQAAIAAGRYLWQRRASFRWPSAEPQFAGTIAFFDVLVHLDRRAVSTGSFQSNYWTDLVRLLDDLGIDTNWLHHYFKHDTVPSFATALRLIADFNAHAGGRQSHAMIDAAISPKVLFGALRDYVRLSRSARRLHGIERYFRARGSAMQLWPLYRREWIDALSGPAAVVNCFVLSLLEHSLRRLPPQRMGFYILENQPWEMALVHAWRANGHGRLIGVPHTTVRYWDLRYFHDPRSYLDGLNGLPRPDHVAVNGPAARNVYLDGGYPAVELEDVEALRFRHLLDGGVRGAPAVVSSSQMKVLVCGDFLAATTRQILSWLAVAAASLPSDTIYLLKPHPAYAVAPAEYGGLPVQLTDAPLGELLADCSVVFASNITSAAVDAYCAGVPVVQMLDGGSFNASPLRGLHGAIYVTGGEQLADALRAAHGRGRGHSDRYFWLDAKLPRWRALLQWPVPARRGLEQPAMSAATRIGQA